MLRMALRSGVVLAVCAVWPAGPAQAWRPPPGFSCSFSVTTIDFGNVNVLSAIAPFTTGTISISCRRGRRNGWVTICPSIGFGSGNPSAWDPRQMASGANLLNYNLYHPGTATIWGSYYWPHPPRPPVLNFRLDSAGNGSWTYTIDARMPAGQTGVRPGVYSSSFSGGDVKFDYVSGYASSCTFPDGTESPAFTVRANVIAYCEVTATDLDFGTVGLLTSNVDTTGQVQVRCTNGTPYEVRLNGGLAGATSPDQRLMTNGAQSVRYGIYRDAARTLGWGDTTASAVSGTGTGSTQVYATYGRVFAQTTPSPGTYTDTVVVTVVY